MGETREQEVVRKIGNLIRSRFGGDLLRAFNHYAAKRVVYSEIDGDELMEILNDSDIGGTFTRGMYRDKIMSKLDTDKNGRISYRELEAMLANPNSLNAK